MAQSFFPAYQIVLVCLLGINIIFWLMLLCWRIFCFGTTVNGISRCRQVFGSIGSTSPMHRDAAQASNFALRGSISRNANNDLPPPYEQAIKYPSLISVSGQISGNNGSMFTNDCSRYPAQYSEAQIESVMRPGNSSNSLPPQPTDSPQSISSSASFLSTNITSTNNKTNLVSIEINLDEKL